MMAAKDNIGNQFIEVFRGFAGVSPDQLDAGRLGRHWSTNRAVAESFANDAVGPDEPSTVVSALVRAKHVIPHDTEEWDTEAGRYGADYGDVEGERTLRPGSRVHVTGITHYPNATGEEHTFRDQMSLKDLRKYRA